MWRFVSAEIYLIGRLYLEQTQLVKFLGACTNKCCQLSSRLFRSYNQEMKNTPFWFEINGSPYHNGRQRSGMTFVCRIKTVYDLLEWFYGTRHICTPSSRWNCKDEFRQKFAYRKYTRFLSDNVSGMNRNLQCMSNVILGQNERDVHTYLHKGFADFCRKQMWTAASLEWGD